MLREQQRIWRDYPDDLKSRFDVIVTDDCSHKDKAESAVEPTGIRSFRLNRLLDKKRWNWLACRNLGAKQADTEWILLTDIDHALPAVTLRRVLEGPLDPECAYRFSRVNAEKAWPYDVSTCPVYKMHPDTWLMTKDLYFSRGILGYDERLSGCYGTSGEFRDRVLNTAKSTVILTEPMIRYSRDVLPDASTNPKTFTRKNDPKNDADLRKRKAERDQIKHWKPLHGMTPYEAVLEVAGYEEVTVKYRSEHVTC